MVGETPQQPCTIMCKLGIPYNAGKPLPGAVGLYSKNTAKKDTVARLHSSVAHSCWDLEPGNRNGYPWHADSGMGLTATVRNPVSLLAMPLLQVGASQGQERP